MHNTEQTLGTAIGELRCVSPDSPASLSELTALSAARDSIDELISSCVSELRANPKHPVAWSDMAYALGTTSSDDARRRHASGVIPATAATSDQLLAFWSTFAERFTWDFLPVDFLYALYHVWMKKGRSEELDPNELTRETFIRRIKGPVTASGEWSHRRSRPGPLMNAPEPLTHRIPQWKRDDSNAEAHGFRRASIRSAAPALPTTTEQEQNR